MPGNLGPAPTVSRKEQQCEFVEVAALHIGNQFCINFDFWGLIINSYITTVSVVVWVGQAVPHRNLSLSSSQLLTTALTAQLPELQVTEDRKIYLGSIFIYNPSPFLYFL